MMARFAAVVLAAVLPVIPNVASAQQKPQAGDDPARRAFELLNGSRENAGLAPLRWAPSLSVLAVRHSREQANRGQVSHHSYEFGLSTERRVLISFPDIGRFGENVARNRSVELIHDALLRSEGHRRNRLDAEFTHVGIGVARGGPHFLYLTEIFVTAPSGRMLQDPPAFYFDARPGSYEQRDNPRVERGTQVITIGPPGPDDPEHWTNVGIEAYIAGDLKAAETAFRTALSMDPDYFYAQYNLARVMLGAGAAADAAVLLDALIERDPGDVAAIAARGSAALLLQDYAGAESYLRKVLAQRPRDAASWYNLGLALEYRDQPSAAEDAYRRALHVDPELHAARVALGRVIRR